MMHPQSTRVVGRSHTYLALYSGIRILVPLRIVLIITTMTKISDAWCHSVQVISFVREYLPTHHAYAFERELNRR